MRKMRTLSWVVPLLLLAAACQKTPEGGAPIRNSQSSITLAELEAISAVTAYQAVERLRPTWLRSRVVTVRGNVPEQHHAQVFVDGISEGDLDSLHRLNARDIREIRFFSASDATTRFGTGYPGGIIEVLTKRGGGG